MQKIILRLSSCRLQGIFLVLVCWGCFFQPAAAADLLDLGNGLATNGIVTRTKMTGGLSLNGWDFFTDFRVLPNDLVTVEARMQLDPLHVEQQIDLLAVCSFIPENSGTPLWFENTGANESWQPWDGNIATLQGMERVKDNYEYHYLYPFSGPWPWKGKATFYFGYRLDDGTIVHNTVPLTLIVADIDMSSRTDALVDVENRLLTLINGERNGISLPTLQRDPGMDLIISWHVSQMATDHFLNHVDKNGRGAEERVYYYSGGTMTRCSEIIQWWGGTPSGDVHYQGYFNSPSHHSGYLEEGYYSLGPTSHAGVAAIAGTGPAGTQYEGRAGSYTGVMLCESPVTVRTDPFVE